MLNKKNRILISESIKLPAILLMVAEEEIYKFSYNEKLN